MKKICFAGYKLLVLVMAITFCASGSLYAQSGQTVSGVVKDGNGEPLIGVSVSETGTTNGVVTGIDGKYTLTLTKNKSTLSFSYMGYAKQTLPVGSRKSIPVTMAEDTIGLGEVIVTGYGKTVTKDKLTAAISKVSAEVLEKGVRANLLTALAGSVTGVRVSQTSGAPGSAPSIQVRAGASLDGSGSPLYIIDGVQKDNLNDINSNDVESIEVLKDAAATALYGARANNGVVLVTTKTGRAGKTSVTLNVNVGKNFYRAPYDYLDAADYLYWERMASHRAGKALDATVGWGTGNDIAADGNKDGKGLWSTTLLTDKNRYLLDYGWQTIACPVTGEDLLFREFDWEDINLQDSYTQDYNVSFTGGNERGKFYSSIGYYKETGFPVDSYYKRLSFNLNADYKVTTWLTAAGFVNFSNAKNHPNALNNDANFFSVVRAAPPTFKGYNLDGTVIYAVNNNQNANMSETMDKYYRREDHFKTTIGTSLKIDLMKGLNLKLNAMWYIWQKENESFNKAFATGPDKINTVRAASAGYARKLDQTYNALLNYDASFAGKHHVGAVAGFEIIDRYSYGFTASGQGATSDDFINLQYTELLDANGNSTRKMNTTHTRERIMSGFINATYDYESKYLLSFSGRYDAYSKLVNNRWGFFPGVSAAWNVYRENFIADRTDIVSNLKLRLGYGQNGNVAGIKTPYELQGTYANTPNYNGTYGILIDDLPAAALRWEKTTSFDMAVETGLWNRLNLTAGYFNKKTADLIANVNLPSSAGVGTMRTNNGVVRSQGMEIEANYAIFDRDDFRWNIGANVTFVKSKIVNLPANGQERNRQNGMQVYAGNGSKELKWVGGYAEGETYGDIYGYRAVRIVRNEADLQNYANYVDKIPSKPVYGPAAYEALSAAEKKNAQQLAPGDAIWQDVDGDGQVDIYDQVKLGNRVPKWMGGFNTGISYKGLSFYARFDYALGYKKWNGGLMYFMSLTSNHFNAPEMVRDTWTETNESARYPVFTNGDSVLKRNFSRSDNAMFWEDASYLCAREMVLSYDLPAAWTRKAYMEKVTLSLTGQNLFYITGCKSYTPEYGSKEADKGGYSLPVSVLGGIKVIF